VEDAVLTLDIEKPTAGGRMLARHNGQIVLVWGAIPGERVRARIERTAKGVIFAEAVDVVSPSTDRRDAPCDWRCGGSVLAHVQYPRQVQLKAEILADAFVRIARMPLATIPSVMASPERGYRMRARLHARGGRIGFIREGSHEVCAVAPTGQLLPATAAWLEAAETTLRTDGIRGLVSMEIAENVTATERCCHLELEPGTMPRAFASLAHTGLTGLSAQVLDRRAGDVLAGVPSVTDLVGPLRLTRDVRAFFQGNRFLLDALVERVATLVPDAPVIDLYAGVGLFGLSLAAARAAHVTLVEGDAISGRDLEANARPYAGHTQVVRSSVEDFLRRHRASGEATCVVDPPRTGMSSEAVHGVVRAAPPRIVYVSCDVATLARDARLLVQGGYSLAEISAIDLFPNTAHVETICLFTREAAGR
jgi:23S rRNA (uracil1939-C5)-methyltransferase